MPARAHNYPTPIEHSSTFTSLYVFRRDEKSTTSIFKLEQLPDKASYLAICISRSEPPRPALLTMVSVSTKHGCIQTPFAKRGMPQEQGYRNQSPQLILKVSSTHHLIPHASSVVSHIMHISRIPYPIPCPIPKSKQSSIYNTCQARAYNKGDPPRVVKDNSLITRADQS